ncbi:MAG: hypothetical protein EOP51_32760, partial [Sphingobacteriales bacterium]
MKKHFLHLILVLCCTAAMAIPPTISTIVPTSAASGMTIQINGADLSGATSVKFGGMAAASFTIVSSTRINAVVAQGSSGQVEVTTADGTALISGFIFIETSGIITDFGGFWRSTGASPNAISPDNSHHLLSFTYNNVTYSTGVNDSRLTANGVSFVPGNFKSLPVAGISGTTPASGSSIYIALAKNVDGSANVGNASTVSSYTVMKSLTDGLNGLDLGT